MTSRLPAWAYPLLLRPRRIEANLAMVERAGIVESVPNLWQVGLGVLRMYHRLLFRPESVGLSRAHAPRRGWRARLLRRRPLRFPFLLAEGSVVPWDLSGLLSTPETLMTHMLGTHHDGNQFVYDLQILACHPGGFEELARRARAVVEQDTPRHRWLRDLCVYEGYHETLLEVVERARRDGITLPEGERDDPDISFAAFLRWCAAQPPDPASTLRAWRTGAFTVERGMLPC